MKINGKEYTYYQATQKQRQYEREIRSLKRQQACGLNTKARINQKTAEYNAFSRKAGISPKPNRLRVVNVDKGFANVGKRGIINDLGISAPIRSRKHPTGMPAGVEIMGDAINARQQRLLDKLPQYNSRAIVPKRSVSMKDLAALTAHTNVEFAVFTKGQERLIIRGERNSVSISTKDARALAEQGYRWSGHTHPGQKFSTAKPSFGDRKVLAATNQRHSSIYTSTGRKYIFASDNKNDIGYKD